MDSTYTRRRLIAGGSGALGVVAALGGLPSPAWPKSKHRHPARLAVYKLDPHWGACVGGKRTHSCYACRACRRHDRYKRFATAKAANEGRAHPHCKCKIVKATFISYGAYVKLFGKPGNLQHTSIDLRSKSARHIFEQGERAARPHHDQGWGP